VNADPAAMPGPPATPRGARRLWRRLDVRIVTLFLGLLLLVQVVSVVAIRQSIEANAQRQIAGELRTGEALLRRLLAQNAQKLTEGARLLSADFGFRAAITSDDQATILDALENQGARIGAAAALFTDAQRRLVASTVANGADLLPLVQANLQPQADAQEARVSVFNGRPYQLVTVPVRAPQLIGHVSMGFPLTADLVGDLARLSPLHMALLVRAHGAPTWTPLAVGDTGAALIETLPAGGIGAQPELSLAGEHHSVRVVMLAEGASHDVAALLLRSIDEAVEPYRRLQLTLLLITLGGVAMFATGSIVTARRVTGPIKLLSSSAERLGVGDYSTPVVASSADEVGELARSFEAMRQAMQQREAQILRLAYRDPLTGLPNRARLHELLRERLVRAPGQSCTVLMLDLDRFKHINDVLGHAFGDRVLQGIGQRLTGGLSRDGDLVARLAGDEFAFFLPGADLATAMGIAQRVRAALELPLTLDEQTVDVGAAIGLAGSPDHGIDADLLLDRAEVAMYAAKEGHAGILAYDPAMDSGSAQSLSLLSELRAAAAGDQFRLYLQPKVSLASGQVLGAEALVRWQHPTRGLVPPMEFIPFAEQTGFIRVLTAWMIERCAARALALRETTPGLKFAVNLSARDLVDQDLPSKIERMAQRGGMDLRQLTLEITESSIMDDPERALQTLLRLREMGLRLSIDDFGTGYSSLAYLKRLPLDELKIDRSFVMSMQRDPADRKIVRSTVDLAHNLGLSVVAEGIEDDRAWAQLRALGCDEGQGYFIARPMPEEDFAAWVRGWRCPSLPELQAGSGSVFGSLTGTAPFLGGG
jgi:diguanylate cyclase (GGDEF)-like protein